MNDRPGTGYPAELESSVTSRDGQTILLRPMRPDDGAALVDFHEHLSDQSVFRRYFTPHPHLSPAEVEHLTNLDYADRLALVAMDGEVLVGVGRYERVPGTPDAEVAFVLADAYQHRGIGTLMLAHLAQAATARGIRTFLAQTQADNRQMIEVFMNSGLSCTTRSESGTVDVRLDLGAAPGPPGGGGGRDGDELPAAGSAGCGASGGGDLSRGRIAGR